ncbi:MAG TPA: hypothetical protein VK771_05320 [Acidimicrobiia bacterium]|nr:hypothetical protein [Acidimicrobiia bacterium]
MRAVAEVAAGVEARLRAQLVSLERMQAAVADALQESRTEMQRRESDLVRAWELVAQACDRTVESVNADQVERRALVATLQELVASVGQLRGATSADAPNGSRVLGGAVFAPTADIDLVDVGEPERADRPETLLSRADLRELPVEVWSFFDADWVGGFEICDAIEHDGVMQYRLRRCSDRSVLPKLFDASEIRAVDRSLQGQQLGLWSRAE